MVLRLVHRQTEWRDGLLAGFHQRYVGVMDGVFLLNALASVAPVLGLAIAGQERYLSVGILVFQLDDGVAGFVCLQGIAYDTLAAHFAGRQGGVVIYRVILCDGDEKCVIAVQEDKSGEPAKVDTTWPVWNDIEGRQIDYDVYDVGELDIVQDVFVRRPSA